MFHNLDVVHLKERIVGFAACCFVIGSNRMFLKVNIRFKQIFFVLLLKIIYVTFMWNVT